MKIILATMLLTLTACTSAGPFITHLESNGDGTILYEQCHVRLNAFLSMIYNHNCQPGRLTVTNQNR